MGFSGGGGGATNTVYGLSSVLPNGEITVDAGVGQADSSGYSRNPPAGTVALSLFTALNPWQAMKYIRLFTGSTAPAGLTAAYAGLYAIGVTTFTLLDQTADFHATVGTSTYLLLKQALLGGNVNLAEGGIYALATLFVGTTAPSLYGTPSSDFGFTAETYQSAYLAGQATLPASIARGAVSLSTNNWRAILAVATS